MVTGELAKATSPVSLEAMKDYGFDVVVECGECEPRHDHRGNPESQRVMALVEIFGPEPGRAQLQPNSEG